MMRNKTTRFIILTVLLIVVGNISMSGFTKKKYGGHQKTVSSTTTGYQVADTVPKFEIKENPPAADKKEKQANLLQRLGDVFKFKKFANNNEKKRVIALLNKLNFGDSIAATQQNVAFLNKYLSDTVNQNIDSLFSLINFLRDNDMNLNEEIAYLESAQGDLQNQLESAKGDLQLQIRRINDYNKIGKDKYASREVSDKDLNILASKIFPIIEISPGIQEITAKMNWIYGMKNIRDSSGIIREAPDPATGFYRKFRISTKNRIEVYGIYNYTTGAFFQSSNLPYLNTLIYNSLYINSQTGDIKDLNGWDTASVITRAQNAGCAIALTFAIENQSNTHDFLTNRNAQANFIRSAVYLMKFRNAGAINIAFSNLGYGDQNNFIYFAGQLYRKLKQTNTDFKFLLTVPATSAGNYYPLSELAAITDRIIIDFSKNYSTVAAPLAALPALTDIASYFIKSKILPEKIVVCLPYHGAKWASLPYYPHRFIEYISYGTLRKNYLFPGYINYLDETTVTAVMDSITSYKDTVRHIFYDDESTLGKKYRFILESGFKGVAVNALGEDFGYSGLWDEMSYAFAIPDTIFITDNRLKNLTKETGLGFFQRLYRRFTLYNYILQNPCEICFENIKDSAQNEMMRQYLLDLDIYPKMKAANITLIKKGENPYRSQFQFVNAQLTRLIGVSTIILCIILLALGIIYFLKTRAKGDNWKGKKTVGRLLLGGSVLTVLFLFTLLFCSDNIPFFGSTGTSNTGYSKDYGTDKQAPGIFNTTTLDYCDMDTSAGCINMPLQTLLAIIILGLIIGGLLTRYLLLPLMKRYETP